MIEKINITYFNICDTMKQIAIKNKNWTNSERKKQINKKEGKNIYFLHNTKKKEIYADNWEIKWIYQQASVYKDFW